MGPQRSRNREKWKRSPVEHVVGYSVQDRRVDPPLRLGPGASVLWAAGYTNMTKLGKLWVLNGAEIRKSENAALPRTLVVYSVQYRCVDQFLRLGPGASVLGAAGS